MNNAIYNRIVGENIIKERITIKENIFEIAFGVFFLFLAVIQAINPNAINNKMMTFLAISSIFFTLAEIFEKLSKFSTFNDYYSINNLQGYDKVVFLVFNFISKLFKAISFILYFGAIIMILIWPFLEFDTNYSVVANIFTFASLSLMFFNMFFDNFLKKCQALKIYIIINFFQNKILTNNKKYRIIQL